MMMLGIPADELAAEDVRFLEQCLDSAFGTTKALILRVLCRFGNPISRYRKYFIDGSPVVRREAMMIAEAQGDAETVASFADEDQGSINEVVMTLKRMGRTEYLTSLAFSSNKEIADLVIGMEETE